MKKLSLIFSLMAVLTFGFNTQSAYAQQDSDTTETEVVVEEEPVVEEEVPTAGDAKADKSEAKGVQVLLEKFVEGGAGFMSLVLIALIFGLAFCIERIITVGLASSNVKSLLQSVEDNLASGNIEGAKDVCKSNRSPVASIMGQGLERVNDGIDGVEKAVVAYGSVEMGRLEKGLSWISLAIALAPMLGFMGTVIGMIEAFDAIQASGDISPTIVAGGIKVALLTTVFGLIAAIILQIFYNYIVSRIDSVVNDMEDASITFVDMLVKHGVVKA